MDIKLKEDLIKFMQKIVNSEPGKTIYDFEAEAFSLEMQLRQSYKSASPRPTDELATPLRSLSPEQHGHYETVLWLTNPMGPRGAGRTHLMALAFIEHSLYYGMCVRIFNHSNYPHAVKEMRTRIEEIISKIKGLHLTFKKNSGEITVSRIPVVSRTCFQENPYSKNKRE